jgi:hypothetical protein
VRLENGAAPSNAAHDFDYDGDDNASNSKPTPPQNDSSIAGRRRDKPLVTQPRR